MFYDVSGPGTFRLGGLLAPPPSCLPLVRRLVVMTPLVALPPPLALPVLCRLLSADASPPVCLLFASWLLHHPCCCAAATSCPVNTPPLPSNTFFCSAASYDHPRPPQVVVAFNLFGNAPMERSQIN